jgi:hypothetical protein
MQPCMDSGVGTSRVAGAHRANVGSDWAKHPYWASCAVLGLLLVLSGIMTYPLVTVLGSRVLGFPADNFEYLYKTWWFKHAVFDLRISPFFDPSIFYPFGYNTALTELTLSNIVPALPLTLAFGEVVAYNAMMLLPFALSGLGMYLLVLRLTRNRTAGLISGGIFAFCPFHMLHLGSGHLPLIAIQWLPLLFLYLDRMIEGHQSRDALMAGLFYSLGALSAWYYAYMFAMAGALYVLLRGRPWRRHLYQWGFLRCAVVFALVSLMLVAPFLLQFVRAFQGSSRTWPLHYLDQLSANPLDFFYPNVLHPLWGQWLMERYPQNLSENVLFLGLTPLALCALALWRQKDRIRRSFAWVALLFAILALGTTLHGMTGRVYIAVPAQLEHLFNLGMGFLTSRLALFPVSSFSLQREGAIYIPLPTLLLYLYLPFYSGMRVWARFGLFTAFGVAALAGWGVVRLQRWVQTRNGALWPGRWQGLASPRLLPTALLAFVLLEFAALPYAMGSSGVQPRPVDRWLADQSGDFAIMEYPLIKAMSGRSYYFMRYHGKRISFGQSTYFPRPFSDNRSVLESFPNQDCLALLKSWGVRYILVGSEYYGADWPSLHGALQASPNLRYVLTADDEPRYQGDRVLRLQPGAETAFIVDRIFVYEVL